MSLVGMLRRGLKFNGTKIHLASLKDFFQRSGKLKALTVENVWIT